MKPNLNRAVSLKPRPCLITILIFIRTIPHSFSSEIVTEPDFIELNLNISTIFNNTIAVNNKEHVLREYRRKRHLDEEDVINRFEIERVSPDYDVLHVPNFPNYLIPGAQLESISSPVTRPKNQTEDLSSQQVRIRSKTRPPVDVDHVVSESGKNYREKTGLNWFISSFSFSNYSNFSSEDKPDRRFSQHLQEKSFFIGPKREYDQNHVVSQAPGSRTARGTTTGDFISPNLSPFRSHGANQKATTPSDVTVGKDDEPKITTRYLLLKSGKIVAINVTSVASVFKPSSGGSSTQTQAPYVFFGSRIKPKKEQEDSGVGNVTTESVQTVGVTIKNRVAPLQQRPKFPVPIFPEVNDNNKQARNGGVKLNSPETLSLLLQNPRNFAQDVSDKLNTRFTEATTISLTPRESNAKNTQKYTVTTPKAQEEQFFVITFGSLKKNHEKSTTGSLELDTTSTTESWWKSKALKVHSKSAEFVTFPSTSVTQSSKSTTGQTVRNSNFANLKTVSRQFTVTSSKPTVTVPPKFPGKEKSQKLADKKISISEHTTQFTPTTEPTVSKSIEEPTPNVQKFKHDFVRIATVKSVQLTTAATAADVDFFKTPSPKASSAGLKKNQDITNNIRPKYRGLSHATTPSTSQRETTSSGADISSTPSSTANSLPPKPTRTARQNQRVNNKFHFRNSVSFHLMPPGALTDRRSLSSSTAAALSAENSTSVQLATTTTTEFVPILVFEPTRRKFPGSTEGNTEQPMAVTASPKAESPRNRTPNLTSLIANLASLTPPPTKAPKIIAKHNRGVPPRKPQNTTPRSPWSTTVANTSPTTTVTEPSTTRTRSGRARTSFKSHFDRFKPSFATTAMQESTTTESSPNPATQTNTRVGRNFKPNRQSEAKSTSSKPLSEEELIKEDTTTRKPFRVYYFEPRRRKPKSQPVEPVVAEKIIEEAPVTGKRTRSRHTTTSVLPPPSTTVKPNRIAPETRERNSTQTQRTPRRSSAFIQHKPNVKTSKDLSSKSQDKQKQQLQSSNQAATEKSPIADSRQDDSAITTVSGGVRLPPANAFQDFLYQPVKIKRRG